MNKLTSSNPVIGNITVEKSYKGEKWSDQKHNTCEVCRTYSKTKNEGRSAVLTYLGSENSCVITVKKVRARNLFLWNCTQ